MVGNKSSEKCGYESIPNVFTLVTKDVDVEFGNNAAKVFAVSFICFQLIQK